MYYRMNYNPTAKLVIVESGAGAAPAALGGVYTVTAAFRLDNELELSTNINGMQALADNHVLFHHIRDYLYSTGVQDMSVQTIYLDKTRIISIGVGVLNVAVGANSAPLAVTATPTNSTDKTVVFTSSDLTKATVNQLGVVRGIAAGAAVITATLVSNNTVLATRNVTVA